MTDTPIALWAVRHRYCLRFVRMAGLRDFLAMLLGRPLYVDESCADCAALEAPAVSQEGTE